MVEIKLSHRRRRTECVGPSHADRKFRALLYRYRPVAVGPYVHHKSRLQYKILIYIGWFRIRQACSFLAFLWLRIFLISNFCIFSIAICIHLYGSYFQIILFKWQSPFLFYKLLIRTLYWKYYFNESKVKFIGKYVENNDTGRGSYGDYMSIRKL